MESLVANYASSDDEEQETPIFSESSIGQAKTSFSVPSILSSLPQPKSSAPSHSSSRFQSLPQPKQTPKPPRPLIESEEPRSSGEIPPTSSSIFFSLPQPKQTSSKSSLLTPNLVIHQDDREDSEPSSKFSSSNSFFSSLHQPISQSQQPPIVNPSSTAQKTKRVVQLAPLLNPNPAKSTELDNDEDDEDEEQERKKSKGYFTGQAPSVNSFLLTLPAARNTATLGVQASSGSGRRAIIETSTPSTATGNSGVENNVIVDQNAGNYVNYDGFDHNKYDIEQNAVNYNVNCNSLGNHQPGFNLDAGVQSQIGVAGSDNSDYGNYDTYGSYSRYADDGLYGNNWDYGSGMGMQEESGMRENAFKLSGKRGRNQVPEEIIEVKQDELMKNRPREDQTKLTGIAFGPSYKPVSTKGKPSKLHKRKHQISSLYFDMKQKEMELAERRAKGMLTKAETHAKYGW